MANINGFDDKNDTLTGTDNADVIHGLGGNDYIVGGAEKDTLYGDDGDDYLEAGGIGAYPATVFGKAADDVLNGGAGNDTAYLDYSNLVRTSDDQPIEINFVFGSTFQIQIQGFTGATVTGVENIWIRLANGDDNVTLGDGNDKIYAGYGDDTVKGGDGDDVVQDVGGKANFDGGEGTDTIAFDWSGFNWGMSYSILTGEIHVSGAGAPEDGDYGKAINFERLSVSGSSGMDTITGGAADDQLDDYGGGAYFDGGGGNDQAYLHNSDFGTLLGGGGNDTLSGQFGSVYIDGGSGNDTLTGSFDKNDTIYGGEGNDTIYSSDNANGFRDDIFDAGAGNDKVYVGSDDGSNIGNAVISGGEGLDFLQIGIGNVHKFDAMTDQGKHLALLGTISGFEIFDIRGNDSYTGFNGDDDIATLDNNDTIFGQGGNDRIDGRGGDDLLEGGTGADTIIGGTGTDTATYRTSYIANTINLADASKNKGDAAGDTYSSIENIVGGSANDTIIGDNNDNVLSGGAEINDSDGDDVIDGGGGIDTAVFNRRSTEYTITLQKDGSYEVVDSFSNGTGTDILIDIEKAQFTDKTINLGVNAKPTGLALSNADIDENAKADTVVGKLSAHDADGDKLTYALANDAGGAFDLHGTSLVSARKFDFEDHQSYAIKVSVSDGSNTVFKSFTISVDDVMETIKGTAKANNLKGGIGADEIIGLAGNDKLTGGKGNDIFVFATGFDKDTVMDFDGKNAGNDRIDLSDLKSIANYNVLKLHMVEKGHDVVIDGGHGDTLTLTGVDIHDLAKGDFLF